MTRRLAGALAACLVAAVPAAAHAHSIVRYDGSTAIYLSADATSLNTLTGRLAGERIDLSDRTVDGGIDPGPCDPGAFSANTWIVQVFCPAPRTARLRIDLGEREDSASLDVPVPVDMSGGPGSDTLGTGSPNDVISGDDGNDVVEAGGGNDKVDGGAGYDGLGGGAGDDAITAADGLADRVSCGSGSDSVDADTYDVIEADCESVQRRFVPAPAGAPPDPNDRAAPRVQAGGRSRQRLGAGRLRMLATTSEPGFLAASGFLDVAGISLPLQSNRRSVAVGGGGAELTIRFSRRQVRLSRQALARGRRATVRMWAVGTDLSGNSAKARPIRIRLRG
jgi:RTX calcium-binding nonapeptide repeat (4 copies)